MKIALLTTHYTSNYGASLQCAATYYTFQKYGDVTIVDYRSTRSLNSMKRFRFEPKLRSILWVLKDIYRFSPRGRLIKKFIKFNTQFSFTNRIKNKYELKELENTFDIFCIGSDQLWNPSVISIDNNLDEMYFLPLLTGRGFTYSTSLGSHKFSSIEIPTIRKYLNNFKNISIREISGIEHLNSLKILKKEPFHLLDPTLYLNKDQWILNSKIEPKNTSNNYILIYNVEGSKFIIEYAQKLSKDTNLFIKIIDQSKLKFTSMFSNIEIINDASPNEFIEIICNSKFVITNSFHGVCFAINFNKQFSIIKPKSSGNRIIELLYLFNIKKSFINNLDNIYDEDNVDYVPVNQRLQKLRDNSKKFLDKVFNV